MRTVSISEARTHWSRLVAEAAAGETITITRRGVPMARLEPTPEARQRAVNAAIDALIEFREHENLSLGGDSIRELIEEGRRS